MRQLTLSDLLTRSQRISLEDRYLFVRQLYVLQKAGVPLLSSLHALQAQLPQGPLRRTLQAVSQDLLNGSTLSQAFARYPHAFDPVFVGLLKIGEAAGLLEQVLKRLTELTEWELELRAQLKQAIQYPLIVIGVLALAMTIMVTFVLPRFGVLFRSLHIELPPQTRVVLGMSWVVTHYGWLLGLALVGILVAGQWYLRTPTGRLWWHRCLLRLPLVGPVYLQLAMARVTRNVASLTASGIPMLEVLALVGESINNREIRQRLVRVQERVKGGESLARAFQTDHLFPPIVTQMVATGEETGHVDELLQSISDYYTQQAKYVLRTLIGYLEPALLILVGIGILVMASAVFVPMWDTVKALRIGR